MVAGWLVRRASVRAAPRVTAQAAKPGSRPGETPPAALAPSPLRRPEAAFAPFSLPPALRWGFGAETNVAIGSPF